MRRVDPVVRDWGERTWHRRDAMRERGRPERRLARGTAVQLQSNTAGERPIVGDGELHEQVVRMLAIVDRLPAAHFPAGEQIRIAAPANRPRLEADPRAHAEGAGRGPADGP